MEDQYPYSEEEGFFELTLPIKGKHIITRKEGAYLGDVVDIYIDPSDKRLSAIIFTKNTFGLGNRYFINADEVEALGEDVIVVSERNCAVQFTESSMIPGVSTDALVGRKVTTLLGKDLGVIKDIQIRPSNLRIGEILFENNKRVTINAADVTIGENAVLVPEDYTSKLVIKIDQSDGLLYKIMSKEKELLQILTDRSRDLGRWFNRNVH